MLDLDIFFIYNKISNTLIENILYPVIEKTYSPNELFFNFSFSYYFICLLIFEDGFSLQF